MKISHGIIILAAVSVAGLLAAQQSFPQRPAPKGEFLAKNFVLHLTGNLADKIPIELTCTLSGPDFVTDQVVGNMTVGGTEYPVVAHEQFWLTAAGPDRYRLDFRSVYQLPVATSTPAGPAIPPAAGQGNVNVGYVYGSKGSSSSVVLKLGQPVQAYHVGSMDLTVTLTAAPGP